MILARDFSSCCSAATRRCRNAARAHVALLGLQALPLAHDALSRDGCISSIRRISRAFSRHEAELARRDALGRFGLMADVPAGVAWYGGVRVWAQPPRLHDFYAITLEQPVASCCSRRARSTGRFSASSTEAHVARTLGTMTNRFGDGAKSTRACDGHAAAGISADVAEKLAENLYVLVNPTLPAPRESNCFGHCFAPSSRAVFRPLDRP